MTAIYPIGETDSERGILDQFIKKLRSHVMNAKRVRDQIMQRLGLPTGMLKPKQVNFFVPFKNDRIVFDILSENHYRKVLLIALRFQWRPEEILALWQTEGLPKWYKHEGEKTVSGSPDLPVRYWFKDSKHQNGINPSDETQARAWAISAILWERWGLDRLNPPSSKKDNQPIGLTANEHSRIFEESFERECAPYLRESPYQYLSNPNGPIKVDQKNGIWLFQTVPEYQSTMISLQMARYKKQIRRIPPLYSEFKTPVYTRTVFPAALYMHYNSPNAEKNFKRLAQLMVQSSSRSKTSRSEFNGDDLYHFYIKAKIPADIEEYVIRKSRETGLWNSHSWVNALRFEFLRQVYAKLFAEIEISDTSSIFLVDEG